MNGCVNDVYRLSCWRCVGCGPGIELIPHPGRFSMSLCGENCMDVIQSYLPLPTGRGSVRPGWRESRKCTYKGRLNFGNEWKIKLIKIKSVALQHRRIKTYWSGCSRWQCKAWSLNLNFSFLNHISLLIISSSYSIVFKRLGEPHSRPYIPWKISRISRNQTQDLGDGT